MEGIAKRFGKDPSTVSYWLNKHGLRAPNREKYAAKGGIQRELLEASVAEAMTIAEIAARLQKSKGTIRHWLRRYGLRTAGSHRIESKRAAKAGGLVEEAGGRCCVCGYDRYLGALQFHHVDPESKVLTISRNGVTQSIHTLRCEARKCVLLCSNCHAEVQSGFVVLPARVDVAAVSRRD